MNASLYLFPTPLGDSALDQILPDYNIKLISSIKYFIVEDVRTARRFLKKCDSDINIDELEFFVLNKHTDKTELQSFINPLEKGENMGLMSEAGCPAIADPGSEVVAMAQEKGYKVVPLVGPSSIFLALMASGFNGQQFAFNGYLPIQEKEKISQLKLHEKRIYQADQTQIYIETPYRNMSVFDAFLKACFPKTKLCIAADLTLETEFIQTKTIKDWKKKSPNLNKRPCIFILYK